MTGHKAKLSEIRQRHEDDAATYVDHGLDSKQGADAHRDRATLLEIVAELESDAKHVRAINATLLESMAAETKRADAAERALSEARHKVSVMVSFSRTLDSVKVLAALGVES